MSRWVDQLGDELDGLVDNVVHATDLDSTHLCALRLIEQLDTEGISMGTTVILADRQSAGSGRGGRSWVSPRGGLYLSWIQPRLEARVVGRLPLLAAVAAWHSLRSIEPLAVRIKWPNDLVIDGKKTAGLICHVRHSVDVLATVGLGVNGNETPTLSEPSLLPPTCLSEHLERDLPPDWRTTLAVSFVRNLYTAFEAPEAALELWLAQLVHDRGDELEVRLGSGATHRGTLIEVTPDGHLRLQTETGEILVTSGDVLES